VEGFARLGSALGVTEIEGEGRTLLVILLQHEIALTLFLCGAGPIAIELITEMRDQGLIPSNYHRRLMLAVIQKLVQDQEASHDLLAELWTSLLSMNFLADAVLGELAALLPYSFDRWDSALSTLDFPGFVELVH
jgi:hypothetical protein